MNDDNYDPSKKYSDFVRQNVPVAETRSITHNNPSITIDVDFKKAEEELTKLILSNDSSSITAKYKGDELEQIKNKFQQQLIYTDKRDITKLKLVVDYLNQLVEYERAKNRLQSVDVEKTLDIAQQLQKLKKIQLEMARDEAELEDIKNPIRKAEREKRLKETSESPKEQGEPPRKITEQERFTKNNQKRNQQEKAISEEWEKTRDRILHGRTVENLSAKEKEFYKKKENFFNDLLFKLWS